MVENIAIVLITSLASIFASNGFWTYKTKKEDKNSLQAKMVLGLGHDKITWLGMCYIKRGYITKDEYENLHDYLYVPYRALGGNGSAERIMKEVMKLPIKTKDN